MLTASYLDSGILTLVVALALLVVIAIAWFIVVRRHPGDF